MDINLLNGNMRRYKKEILQRNFFFCVAQDARGRDRAFEVAERSEVGALESLASNLVRLAALVALVNLAYLAALAFYQKRLPNY